MKGAIEKKYLQHAIGDTKQNASKPEAIGYFCYPFSSLGVQIEEFYSVCLGSGLRRYVMIPNISVAYPDKCIIRQVSKVPNLSANSGYLLQSRSRSKAGPQSSLKMFDWLAQAHDWTRHKLVIDVDVLLT